MLNVLYVEINISLIIFIYFIVS